MLVTLMILKKDKIT